MARPQVEFPPLDAPDAFEPSDIRTDGDEVYEVWCGSPRYFSSAHMSPEDARNAARKLHGVVYQVRRKARRWE